MIGCKFVHVAKQLDREAGLFCRYMRYCIPVELIIGP